MGTTNSRPKPKKILKKKVETKDESVEIEEINIIDDVSENSTEYQRRKEEEEQEEERKKEEIKQNVLRIIKKEEEIEKINFSNEEFTNYIIRFFEEFIQIFYSLPKKNVFISLVFEFNKKYVYSFFKKEFF